MTIDEAIKILGELDEGCESKVKEDRDALKLGIEALKHIKRDRELPHNPDHPLLPGETK